jgi:hypothetical protein
MTKNLYLTFLSLVFISSSAFIQAEYEFTIEQRQLVDSMTVEELKDRKLSIEGKIAELEDEQENTQNPSANKNITDTIAELNAELVYIVALLVGAGAILSDGGEIDDAPVVRDLTPPVITINGDNPATVELGGTYTDAGATASDDSGSASLVTSGTVDTNTVGVYQISYVATDAAGNISQAFRTVNVVDTTAPVVTVTGDNPVTVELGDSYTDAGATATDLSGDVTVVTTGTVDTDTVGTYTLTYTSTDASGNAGTATRTVNVVDTTAPVFTSSATFSADENQTAIGTVTATDPASVSFSISGSEIQITSAGVLSFVTAPDYENKDSYNATVTVTDASSNSATQDITVSINNLNDNNPVITSASAFSVDENETSVGSLTATDADGDSITFTLAGTDADSFTLNSPLAFAVAPDYEVKSTYSITVVASDGTNEVEQTVTITVNNLNDNTPVVTSDGSITVPE